MKRYNNNKRYIQDFELRKIEYDCLLINEMWNRLSDEEKRIFWGKGITSVPIDFSNNCNNINEIPDWCFH